MLVHHTTKVQNLASIFEHGLLCSKSKGKAKVVWVHSEGRTGWAWMHVVSRHHCRPQSVCRLTVSVPRSWCRRSKRGLWYVVRDVPASRILATVGFGPLSASPIQEA